MAINGPRRVVPALPVPAVPRHPAAEPNRCDVSQSNLNSQQQAATLPGGLFYFLGAFSWPDFGFRFSKVLVDRVFLFLLFRLDSRYHKSPRISKGGNER